MNRTAIRAVLILGILAITGIISVQFYFVKQAMNQEKRQMNQTITIALTSVAEDLARYNDAELPRQNPVFHHSPDYYIVNVNTHIEPDILEQFLVTEFKIRRLTLDFEYGIYDCQTDKMVYGRLVRLVRISGSSQCRKAFPSRQITFIISGSILPVAIR